MKTFAEFQESVASLALKGGLKLLPKIPSALKAVTAGTLTGLSLLQAKRSQDTKASRGRRSEKPKRKISAAEKKIFDGQKKDIIQKGSDEFSTKGLIKRNEKFTKQTRRGTTNKPENQFHTEDAIPTNSTGPAVLGTGDDSSTVVVNKKKRYIYGGTGSRKMWMNNK